MEMGEEKQRAEVEGRKRGRYYAEGTRSEESARRETGKTGSCSKKENGEGEWVKSLVLVGIKGLRQFERQGRRGACALLPMYTPPTPMDQCVDLPLESDQFSGPAEPQLRSERHLAEFSGPLGAADTVLANPLKF